MKKISRLMILAMCLVLSGTTASAEEPEEVRRIKEIFSTPSPTGYEGAMAGKIIKSLPDGLKTERDNLGSLYVSMGKGKEHIAVVTGMDEHGYFVSGFRDDGYLTLDRVSGKHDLFDFYNIGHPVLIWSDAGKIPGVLAVPSLHIATSETRSNLQSLLSLDNALVDIGVRTPDEAERRGVRMMDAVTPWPEWTALAGGRFSGPGMGLKSLIAALIQTAAEIRPDRVSGEISIAWLAQTKFLRGRSRRAAAMGSIRASNRLDASAFIVVDVLARENGLELGKGPALIRSGNRDSFIIKKVLKTAAESKIPLQSVTGADSPLLNPFLLTSKDAVGLFLPAAFKDTPSEMVDIRDVDALVKLLTGLLTGEN